MSPERFQHMLQQVGPFMPARKCKSRCPISKEERLCLTLRYLASGDSQQSISYNFRIGKTTVHNIVKKTCEAIWEALSETYLKQPTTCEEWEEIAKDMLVKWNFPNCIGSLDGKHIAIECPKYSAILFQLFAFLFPSLKSLEALLYIVGNSLIISIKRASFSFASEGSGKFRLDSWFMHSIFSLNVTRSLSNNNKFCKSIVFQAIVRREPSGKSNMFDFPDDRG